MNNNTKEYGYIRVSSKTQNVARQIKMMKERGIPDKRIYIDKMSGRNFERKEYKKLMVANHPDNGGDVVTCQEITAEYKKLFDMFKAGQTPEEEKYLETKDELLAKITTFMAGRAAEVLVFHSATSGAANDIENATKIARAMVTMYGMSDTFGMMCLATVENQYLDGRAGLICGEDTAGQIDKEVLSIINKSYEDAMQMLTENRDILDHISDYLYEKETITGKEFMKIFREMKGLPQEEDKESLMPDDTADEKKASQEPRVLSKENNEAKDGTSIAEDSQSKAAIVSDDMFEE